MASSLKTLLDTVNDEIGFERANSYIGSTDANIRTLVAQAQKSAKILRDLNLQKLVRQSVIALNTATVDLSMDPGGRISWVPLPTDFYAYTFDTIYQDGRIDPAQMPTPAPTWAYLISRAGPQSLRVRLRELKDRLYIFSPDASQTINFEYISKNPITVVSGVPAPAASVTSDSFTTDNDTWDCDDTLFVNEVKWRYLQVKAIGDWNTSYQDAQNYQNLFRARDGGATTILPPQAWPFPSEPYTNLWVDT
jgi:hypothetical protein